MIIFDKPCNHHYDQMLKALANQMFLRFPKAPLATLTWIKRYGEIPTETKYAEIVEKISELHSSVDSLSKEMDDLTMKENETSPDKRKHNSYDKNTDYSAKKFKRNDEADMRSVQVELSSVPGRKFENKNGNNTCYMNSVSNGLLALNKYREKLNEEFCYSNLCKVLNLMQLACELRHPNSILW